MYRRMERLLGRGGDGDLRFSEVIAALSRALDLTDGHDLGHAVRTSLIGMRIAQELGLPDHDRSALLYGLLLKDAGCSSNAAKVAAIYRADDHPVKRGVKLVDYSRPTDAIRYIRRNVGGDTGVTRAVNAVRATVLGSRISREMTAIRCERGAEIALMLDLPVDAADAIRTLDEHWDGRGHPMRLAGEEIPLFGRILCLAQTVEVFASREGLDAAYAMADDRDGRWFDPTLVRALHAFRGDRVFWGSLADADAELRVTLLEPADRVVEADDARLDRVAEAFALVIDAKSPYTSTHSVRVADIAVELGRRLGIAGEALRGLRRAGLLHDIGKLGVSNRILDKPGKLDDDEWAAMRAHTAHTLEILSRVRAFADLAPIAAAHHEKLDGSGYHLGLAGAQLPLPARILAVADVYEALTVDRPYRAALCHEDAMAIIGREAGPKLDADVVSALEGGDLPAAVPLAA